MERFSTPLSRVRNRRQAEEKAEPWYVVDKDLEKNRLIVGQEDIIPISILKVFWPAMCHGPQTLH